MKAKKNVIGARFAAGRHDSRALAFEILPSQEIAAIPPDSQECRGDEELPTERIDDQFAVWRKNDVRFCKRSLLIFLFSRQ